MTFARRMALGGIFAGLAVTIMAMGTIIPVATYVCPTLCILLLEAVRILCGTRTAWAWYGAVAVLSLLLAPDKEAAVIFVLLGYYPVIKPKLERSRGRWLWKALYFNISVLVAYTVLIFLMGLEEVAAEFFGIGIAMTAALLVLGNFVFFYLDRLLSMGPSGRRKFRRNHGR